MKNEEWRGLRGRINQRHDSWIRYTLSMYHTRQINNEPLRVGYLLKDAYSQLKTHPQWSEGVESFMAHYLTTPSTNRNGASHFSYVSSQTDTTMEVTAQDLHIHGLWALVCQTPFRISAKEIFELLLWTKSTLSLKAPWPHEMAVAGFWSKTSQKWKPLWKLQWDYYHRWISVWSLVF